MACVVKGYLQQIVSSNKYEVETFRNMPAGWLQISFYRF